jgi:hypothetical protein
VKPQQPPNIDVGKVLTPAGTTWTMRETNPRGTRARLAPLPKDEGFSRVNARVTALRSPIPAIHRHALHAGGPLMLCPHLRMYRDRWKERPELGIPSIHPTKP